jgi:hypothetical protein
MERLLFRLCLPALVLSACNPDRPKPVDPATLQTAAAAEALRYVIDHCPKRAEAELAVVVIGDEFAKPSTAFVDRLRSVEGLQFIDSNRAVWGGVGGRVLRYDEHTGKPVLDLKVSAMSQEKNGTQEASVAWAWREDGESFRLEMKAKPEGGYEIRELEKTTLKSPAAAEKPAEKK